MVALPLSVLAFAAGVYLLIKVKREYLNSVFSVLAWLVIIASLASLTLSSLKVWHHLMRERHQFEKRIIIKDGEEGRHLERMSGCQMHGCTMEGDSCVLDKETCEKLIGKEECDKLIKERGRCIMSMEECDKYFNTGKGMMSDEHEMMKGKGGCCMGKAGGGKCGHHQ